MDIIAAIEDYELDDMWFELRIATMIHTASLHENFPERHISRFSNANWLHKSLDLTTFEFLWEYIKEGDTALFHLTPANILYVIQNVIVIENLFERNNWCNQFRGK